MTAEEANYLWCVWCVGVEVWGVECPMTFSLAEWPCARRVFPRDAPCGVVIAKAGDPRDGEEATVVQDDRDAQPFRLRFADAELSMVFYREHQVKS